MKKYFPPGERDHSSLSDSWRYPEARSKRLASSEEGWGGGGGGMGEESGLGLGSGCGVDFWCFILERAW